MAIDRDGDGPPLRKKASSADEADTLRATPFTEDVFDDDYYRGRGRSSGGSPFGLIVGVVVGAAVAGAAAWFVLGGQSGGSLTASGGDTPVIKADPSPYKIKPENPGGLQVENQDKTVYDRVAKTDAPNRIENLLPPAEKPKTPPKVEAPKDEPKPAPPAEAKTEDVKPEEAKVVNAKPVDAKPADSPSADVPPAKTPEQEKKDDLAVMIAALDGKKPAESQAPPPAAAAPTEAAPQTPALAPTANDTPKEIAAPAPTTEAAGATGGFQVQLAAAKSEEAALSEWNRIKNRHPDLLGSLKPSVVRADLGDKGVFYRLRAGFLTDKAATDALCAAMVAQGDACLVIKP